MRRRTVFILLAVVLVGALLGGVLYLRHRAAPEAARLLPADAQAILYVDAQTIRRATRLLGQPPPVVRDPDYDAFVRQTGFQFENDLDEVAAAVHVPPSAPGAPPPSVEQWRFSEIVVARFDDERLTGYLKKLAISSERYRDLEIYSIPSEGLILRVAILSVNLVALSSTDTPAAIHEMIDRYKASALPVGGPPLLREAWHEVPFGSLVWAIGRISSGSGSPGLPGPDVLRALAPGAVLVASVRYAGTVQFRAEALAKDAEEARHITENAGIMLSIYRSVESSAQMGGNDPDVKALFDSIQVEQEGNHAVLKATFSPGFLRKAFAQAPLSGLEAAPAPQTPPKAKPAPKRGAKSKKP